MFANDSPNCLSRDKKFVCEIVSMLAFIFSVFVTFVAYFKIKMTITNVLIMQIIMSEILDGVNIILAIAIDSVGFSTFENYSKRMGICFTQIYLGVFSCLWNLFSSLFISIRIYDRMQNKNRIFKNKFMYEYTTTLSYGIPCIITYILWTWQVLDQSITLRDKNRGSYYDPPKQRNINFFRYMYCWVGGWTNITLSIISFLLIAANFYFSFFKSALFIRKISREIEDVDDKNNKVSKIKKIMCNLILYPLVSGGVWIFYFVLQILTWVMKTEQKQKDEVFVKSMKHGVGAWCIIFIICARQIIFTLMFFLTQGNLKRHAYNILTCKKSKNTSSRATTNIINEKSDDAENNKLLNDFNE